MLLKRNSFIFFVLTLILLTSGLNVCFLLAKASSNSIQGWALVVCGANNVTDEFYAGAKAAYNALLNCGFTDDTIYYMDTHDRDELQPPLDNYTTRESFIYAINNFLILKSDDNDLVVICLVNHGNRSYFYLGSKTENFTYSELNSWISTLNYGRLIVVVDACDSRCALIPLSREDRIIISSADKEEVAWAGFFSALFWPETVSANLIEAFNYASEFMWNLSKMGFQVSRPYLHDDGTGTGAYWSEYYPLPNWDEGYLAQATYLNVSKMANLAVKANGFKADGSVETLTGVNVTIDQYINRNTPVNIILAKGDYTIKVLNVTKIGDVTWCFRDWEGGSTNNSRSLALSEDKTISVNYVDFHTLAITVIPDSCGTTDPTPGTHTYSHGMNVTVKAIENVSRYVFDHWVLDGGTVGSSPEITVFMNTNHTLEARFKWVNNPPENPTISGPSTGDVGVSYSYTACTTDPEGNDVLYWFDWGDGSVTMTDWYASGTKISRSHSWSSSGGYVLRVKAQDVYGAWSGWSGLVVVIGEACPYVYTWNGSAYVLDNNVLAESEVSNGSDVEDFYRLEQTMIPLYSRNYFSAYSLKLGEFENEHSYIDKVRLIAVDHDPNVNIAVTPDGQILTYANPNSPVSAVDNYGYDRLPALLEMDGTYYRGFPDNYLLLDFGSLDVSQAAKLVLRANLEWKKEFCIHVQVLDAVGGWTDAATLRTRYHWSTLIVDLADYLPNPDGTLKIRLYFNGIHKIDYVGLGTTPQADTTIIQTNAVRATHSTNGDVTLKLLLNDQAYAELFPGEQIKLKFILPNNKEKTRTFIIYIEGHYETIP